MRLADRGCISLTGFCAWFPTLDDEDVVFLCRQWFRRESLFIEDSHSSSAICVADWRIFCLVGDTGWQCFCFYGVSGVGLKPGLTSCLCGVLHATSVSLKHEEK